MKILITGGAGFIGSHLVDRFIKKGDAVSIIDDLSGGSRKNLNPNAIFYNVDLRDVKKADKIIRKIGPQVVYHLAANAAENKAQFSPIDITSRNYNTFINTLVPSIKYGMKRFIITSSVAVYGAVQIPFKEKSKPEPEDLYGISKLAMEETLKILAKVHGFEFVITRPHNVYGPRQNMTDPYRNVVTIFMNAILKGKPYYIYGDGKQRRCFSYIDDVIEAIYNCAFAQVDKKVFNIGADKDYSLNELSELIQNVAGVNIPPIYIEDRPQEVKMAIAEHTQAKKYLDYKDKIKLKDGIEKTWNYVKILGPQKEKFTKIELPSPKLPTNWKMKNGKKN